MDHVIEFISDYMSVDEKEFIFESGQVNTKKYRIAKNKGK